MRSSSHIYRQRTTIRFVSSLIAQLLLLATSVVSGVEEEPHHPAVSQQAFDAGEWREAGSLGEGSVLSSVVFANQSLFVVGGCLSPDCLDRSSVVTHYNPQTEQVEQSTQLNQGIAGLRSTVTLEGGVADGIYICHMCSMLMPGEDFNATLRSTIGKIDVETGELVEMFLNLSQYTNGARANASCVTYGDSLYIVGGLVQSQIYPYDLVLTPSIAKYDFFTQVYDVIWENHPTKVMDAAVAKDSSGFYVSGGLELEEGDHLQLSKIIKAYYPHSGCKRELSTQTDNGVPPEVQSSDFTFLMWGQMLIFVAPHRDVFYSRPFGIAGVAEKWMTYNMSANVQGTAGAKAGEQGLLQEASLSSIFAVPMLLTTPTATNDTSATLVLFQFGGFEWVTVHSDPLNPNVTTEERVLKKSIQKTITSIRTPGPLLEGEGLVNQYEKWSLNISGLDLHTGCGETKECKVALAVSPACESPHASDTDPVSWLPGQPIVFLPRGTSNTVYLCFSYGDMNQICEREGTANTVQQVYYPTNLFHPYSIVAATVSPGPPTPVPNSTIPGSDAPPPTTAVPGLAPPNTSNMLVYVLATVAGVTTILAICLVARLRKVPDDGILASTGGGAGGGPSALGPQFSQHEDRYKTVAKIGEGAFSAVYLVIRRKDGKRFAMKHMECQSDSARQDAIKECEIMRTLQGHPNVISLVDMFMNYEFDAAGSEPPSDRDAAGEDGTRALLEGQRAKVAPAKRSRHLCLVMEYHASGDLKRWLTQFAGHPSEAILCSISFQIVSVLVHIHNQEPPVIHRDLKPENLLINQNAAPSLTFLPIVVTDFGLARLQEESHCKQGAGTLPYVAPECFRKNYTTQCDLWSLGCVLYALATKRVTHDKVRLMFEDCRLKNFESLIRSDLHALGYHAEFTNFVLLLLQVDPSKRLTASGAFKLFRRRGEMIYLTSRIAGLMSSSSESSPAVGGAGGTENVSSHKDKSTAPSSRKSKKTPPALIVVPQPPSSPVAIPAPPNHTAVDIGDLPESSLPPPSQIQRLMVEPCPFLGSTPTDSGINDGMGDLATQSSSMVSPKHPTAQQPTIGSFSRPCSRPSSVLSETSPLASPSSQVRPPPSSVAVVLAAGVEQRNSQGGEDPQSKSCIEVIPQI